MAYAHVQGDIVAIIGKPGGGKTWASERYCAGRTIAFNLSASSAVFSLPGFLSLVGEAIGVGRHHHSALEAERTIIDRLRDRQALIAVDEAHHLRDKLPDELRIIRDRAGCGLALVADETICMALARCQHVDGRIGRKSDLATQPTADVEDIAAGVLGRRPTTVELKTLNTVGKGPGGLHAMRRLLGRARMVAQAAGRDTVETGDITAAADEGVAAVEGAAAQTRARLHREPANIIPGPWQSHPEASLKDIGGNLALASGANSSHRPAVSRYVPVRLTVSLTWWSLLPVLGVCTLTG